jgi:lipopolysaccharide export LptBFGC system permease protein LptF
MQKDINKNKVYNKDSIYKYTTKNIFIHYKRCIVTAEIMDPASKTVKGVNVYVFNDKFMLAKRYIAETGYFGKSGLKLTGGQEDDFGKERGRDRDGDNGFVQKNFKTINIPIYLNLNFFRSYTLKPEFLSIVNLSEMIAVAKKSESGLSYILTSYYSKLSFPVINLILILIGISIGLLLGKKGNSPVSIGISLVFAFTWWVINSIALSLGESAQLNPMLSAFMSDIIFLSFALYLIMDID